MTGDRDRPAHQSPVADCAAAFLLLSRIPAGWYRFPDDRPPDFTSATWAFPLVGLVIGASGGAALGLAGMFGLPPFLAAAIGILVMTLLSGAMHEDGLADMADGFGGGHDVESTMRIMHDSRIGSYGVLALILATAMRLSLLMVCLERFALTELIFFLGVISAASRFQPVMQLAVFPLSPHARLATLTGRPDTGRIIMAMALWIPALAWLTGPEVAAATAVPAMAASLWIGGKAVRRVEGLTGDVMGATTIISEIIMLMCWITAGSMLAA